MKNEHDQANDKNAGRTSPAATRQRAASMADEQSQDRPALPSSTTALAEEIRPPVAKPEADVKAAHAKLAPLQSEYEELLTQIADAKVDPLKYGQLIRRKGAVTREMDQIKRANGID